MNEERDCKNCAHYVIAVSKKDANGVPTICVHGCEVWDCEFKPIDGKEGVYCKNCADELAIQSAVDSRK